MGSKCRPRLGHGTSQWSHSSLLSCWPRYGPHYIWAQLSSWFKQTVYDPTASLSADRRGTLSLPEVESCYTTKEKYDSRVSQEPLSSAYQSSQGQLGAFSAASKPAYFQNDAGIAAYLLAGGTAGNALQPWHVSHTPPEDPQLQNICLVYMLSGTETGSLPLAHDGCN